MNFRFSSGAISVIITALVLVALGLGLAAVLRIDNFGEQGSGLSDRFEYDLDSFQKTDPALVSHRETAHYDLPLAEPSAIAVGLDDQILVGGDRQIVVLSAEGKPVRSIALDAEPTCLAVAQADQPQPGRIYVGIKDHVELYAPDGARQAAWETLGSKALITSIATGEQDVYVANAGGRIVLRFSPAGKLLGRIGQKDPDNNVTGFIIPSPYFDVAVGGDGLVRVVNPGTHHVQGYTPEGHLELSWGKAAMDIKGFCGCCNPAHLALLADGRYVTAEKGVPRVKIYTAEGEFQSVVAGPEAFLVSPTAAVDTRTDHKPKVLDVAADSRSRILVLDPLRRSVRVFEPVGKEGTQP